MLVGGITVRSATVHECNSANQVVVPNINRVLEGMFLPDSLSASVITEVPVSHPSRHCDFLQLVKSGSTLDIPQIGSAKRRRVNLSSIE